MESLISNQVLVSCFVLDQLLSTSAYMERDGMNSAKIWKASVYIPLLYINGVGMEKYLTLVISHAKVTETRKIPCIKWSMAKPLSK